VPQFGDATLWHASLRHRHPAGVPRVGEVRRADPCGSPKRFDAGLPRTADPRHPHAKSHFGGGLPLPHYRFMLSISRSRTPDDDISANGELYEGSGVSWIGP
jgi:hypothetical protein